MTSESGTSRAMESLADRLDLPLDTPFQDWPCEMADSNEIDNYLKLYDSLNNKDEKLVLMQIIIHATRKLWDRSGLPGDWDRVERQLTWDFGIHKHTIQKWAGQEDESTNDPGAIASNMRELLTKTCRARRTSSLSAQ